jgi:DNA-directed RNA polymerase specialized sigma24 family protein
VRAYETILSAYWKPSYKYIRLKWQAAREDAEDLTQGFFAKAFEKSYFERYDHTIGSFHAFLRVCIDRFVSKERQAQGRQKRGGETFFVPLDFSAVEEEFSAHDLANKVSMEEYFHQEWVRSLFALSIEALTEQSRKLGKELHVRLFELYDLEDEGERPTYEMLARRFGLKTTDVTNYLAFARREFRKIILAKLREMTATDEEFRSEARMLFGVDL